MKNAKSLKEKEASELSARIQDTNKDKVNEIDSKETKANPLAFYVVFILI